MDSKFLDSVEKKTGQRPLALEGVETYQPC